MKLRILLLNALLFGILLTHHNSIFGQGVTTSGINGKVTDAQGAELLGAAVVAVHVPTGSRYGNITNVNGYYRIPNMKVGGPYKVSISFVGFEEFSREGVSLTLGQTFKLDVSLESEATELEVVVVTASNSKIFDGNRTGVETSISQREIGSMPNASRSLNDFTRMTPQTTFTSTGGLSIAGSNNRYNSIFIDGAMSNDVFGLAGNGQNGGQLSGLSLISIDAMEQISVAVSPYDVTQSGFTGGSISAVTRSGSNEFEGSVYYFVRNESLAGKTPGFLEVDGENRERLDKFSAKTYGLRLGGSIIKNKLFFFVNTEIQKDETPQPFNFANYNGSVTKSDLNSLTAKLNEYGYDPGSYEDVVQKLEAEKLLVKLDWNISDKHKLTLRHSYNKGETFSPGNSSTSQIRFENNGVLFPSITHSSALELNSNFGNYSNKLVIGRTSVKDNRDPIGDAFPYVSIDSREVQFGSEPFSTANFLEQKIWVWTDNFNIYKGKHTITIGTHNEFYDINNVFIRQNFGAYQFNSIADFVNDMPSDDFDRSYSLVDNVTGDGTSAAAKFKAMQIGFYVQDEFQVSDKLKITGGLRVDIPFFLDDPAKTEDWDATKAAIEAYQTNEREGHNYDLTGVESGKSPEAQLMLAPRIGFNYDVNGDQTTQVRGGLGIFTSRIPFVWPSGMYNNNGVFVGGIGQSDLILNPDPNTQPTAGTDAKPQGQLDLFAKDFKYPQVFRTSLGVDQKLLGGLVGSIEVIYTKTINNVFYKNVNLKPNESNFFGGADKRPIYNRRDAIDPRYTRILVGSNTDEGHTANITVSLTKPWDNGFTAGLSYNYGTASSIFEGTSSQNSSQWRGVYSVNGRNNATVGTSDFDAGHRFMLNASYRKEYAGFMSSTVSFFYNIQSGSPFSYTYHRDISNEDSRDRALIFVPAFASQIVFDESNRSTADQWADLNAYIENDDYLRNRRGRYAEKNEARLPVSSIIDVKFMQEFFIESTNGKRQTLQVTFDIFNFGNLINKNWGKRYRVPNGDFTSVHLLNSEGNTTNAAGETVPVFSFDDDVNDKRDLLTKDDSGLISARWQMQLGVRYIFGN